MRDFSPQELAFVQQFKRAELSPKAGTILFEEGAESAHLYTVLSGWAVRFKEMPDGRRQVLNFALPGDFIGLQGAMLSTMQHSVQALTDMLLCVFPRARLWDLYERCPSLAFDVTWLAARQERLLDENLLSLGRRSALERAACLLLSLFVRAERVGLVEGNRVLFPFTQQDVADALGLSLVHTNRTLHRLARTGTMRWRGRSFELLDRTALTRLAGYEPPAWQQRPFI